MPESHDIPDAEAATQTTTAPQDEPFQAEATLPGPGVEVSLIKALTGTLQPSEGIPVEQWQAALSAAAVARDALVRAGLGAMLEQIDRTTDVNSAIATVLSTGGFIEKWLTGNDDISYTGTYDMYTIKAIGATLQAYYVGFVRNDTPA